MNGLVRDVKRRKSLPLRNCHLLAIGIDSYKNHPTLNNAVGDVEKICECLTEFYGIDTDKVKTLFNKEATKTNILKALRNYFDNKNAQNNLGINDTLVIYFAGHGYKDSALGSGGWIPHESEEDLDEYISASEIIKYLKRIKAQHCFLIMDSCFAAEFLSSDRSNSKANQHKNIDKLIKSDKMPSKWILCSGHDTVKDGNLNDHSPFAKSFLEVLYENTEDYISVYEIIYQTKKKVKRNSFGQEAIGNRLNGQGLGDFYFRKNKQAIIKEIYQKPEDVSIKTARKKWRSFIINFKQKNPYMSRKKTLQFNDRSWDQEDKAWNLPVISIPNFKVLSLQTKNEEISRDPI